MGDRWLLVDTIGRNMSGFRTRGAARRWLADVGTSNPPAVAGWHVVNAKDFRPMPDDAPAKAVNIERQEIHVHYPTPELRSTAGTVWS